MAIHYTPTTPTVSDLTLHLQMSAAPVETPQALRDTFFPAEWHPQSGIQLTWPHAGTDWAPLLHEVDNCFVGIALEVLTHGERVLIVTPEPTRVKALLHERLPQRLLAHVSYCECPTDDTWARDHAPLTLVTPHGPRLLDFRFDGWGLKFAAAADNQIGRHLRHCLKASYEAHLDFTLEGGSIESDGCGTLLTTTACLLSPNRNPMLTQQEIEARLLRYFHARRVLWLHHGRLAGDDTDSHIDTLARFCTADTIAYVRCTDTADEHYAELQAMEQELHALRTTTGEPYHLVPLPMPDAICDPDDGHRLPATYANFLVLNNAVLMPTYRQPANDEAARQALQHAFPRRDIVPVDCRVLIRQHGSLHCSTMQYPTHVM